MGVPKKSPQMRKRRGMMPADERALCLLNQLLASQQLIDKQVSRVLGRRGYDVHKSYVQKVRDTMGLPSVKRLQGKASRARDLEAAELKEKLIQFRKLYLSEKLERLEKVALDEMRQAADCAQSAVERNRIELKMKRVRLFAMLFAKGIPVDALKERGIDFLG